MWRIYKRAERELDVTISRQNRYKTRYGYITVPPAILFGSNRLANNKVPLKEVYLLNRSRVYKDIEVKSLPQEVAANLIFSITCYEWCSFMKFLFEYIRFSGKSLSEFFGDIESLVSSGLRFVEKMYIINIPADKEYSSVIADIEKIVM